MPDEFNEEEVLTKEEQEDQDAYDKAYAEGDLDDKDKKPDVTPPDEKDVKVATPPDEDPPDVKPPDDKDKEKEKESGEHGDLESVTKALNDTKTYASNLAGENKLLKEKQDAYDKGQATEKDLDDAKKAKEIAQGAYKEKLDKFYEDYPEAKEVLDPLVDALNAGLKKVDEVVKDTATTKEEADRIANKAAFEKEVLPDIQKIHPDAKSMIDDTRFWKWATEIATPGQKYNALESGNPADIAGAITAFKGFLATPEANKMAKEKKNLKEKIISNATTLRTGSDTRPNKASDKENMQDYDAGWDEADKQLEREGVT